MIQSWRKEGICGKQVPCGIDSQVGRTDIPTKWLPYSPKSSLMSTVFFHFLTLPEIAQMRILDSGETHLKTGIIEKPLVASCSMACLSS